MMQSPDLGYRHYLAQLRRLNCPGLWRVLFQGKVRPGFVIIGKIN
jgi:hypothetical protein